MTNRSMCYAAMSKWEKSLRDAEKSVELNKNWAKGYYRKGVALQNLGKSKDAFESFEAACKIEPKSDDFKKAFEAARKEMYKGMSEAEILKMDGNQLFKIGKVQEAIDTYTKALKLCDEKDEKAKAVKCDILANRAACYVQLYEPVKVRADCDEALRLCPDHTKALMRRGQSLEALEKYKLALEDFEKVTKLEPHYQNAHKACVRVRNALRQSGQL
jgi:tetratricopeptide (TPR) repeat protein